MMVEPISFERHGVSVVVYPDAEALAAGAALRLVEYLGQHDAASDAIKVALTGGTIANRTYSAVASLLDEPTGTAGRVDWSRVDLWWGDERFLPPGHPDRNATQAAAALLDHPLLAPAGVHPMPDSDSGPVEAGAMDYAAAVASVDPFDLVLLGIGEDGHVASLFPGHPQLAMTERAVAVRNSPKPPPTRISLTLPVLNRAEQVWILASGSGKAEVVGSAMTQRGPNAPLPAGRVSGRQRTVLLVDRSAAAPLFQLGQGLGK